jgi:hypothetical protein
VVDCPAESFAMNRKAALYTCFVFSSCAHAWQQGVHVPSSRACSSRPHSSRSSAHVTPAAVDSMPVDNLPDSSTLYDSNEESDRTVDPDVIKLLQTRCQTAVEYAQTAAATTSSGSSEWSGFWTDSAQLESIMAVLEQCAPQWRGINGASLAWSWLGVTPVPLRVQLFEGTGYGLYLTVLPPESRPPAHRFMIGAHCLSKVCQGDVEQIKANGQRIIGRARHTADTPVWSR